VSTVLYSIAVLITLLGLLFWARRRATTIRERAHEREQEAMAMLLVGKGRDGEANAAPEMPVIGRVLEDPADRVAAKAREAARVAREAAEQPTVAVGPARGNGASPPSPAEQAAEGMDPIEELISQIMVDTPTPKPRKLPVRPRAAERAAAPPPESPQRPEAIGSGVPLRELVLAWYESRGYRGSPASPAVWPIEMVLRHRDDAARAYAFVVQSDHISVDRITALIEQAREIGMQRVAVVAESGYERGAKEIARKKHVRLIDRSTMDAELSALELPTAAKIIAVARKRSSPEASTAA
jgi:hypothetical protein